MVVSVAVGYGRRVSPRPTRPTFTKADARVLAWGLGLVVGGVDAVVSLSRAQLSMTAIGGAFGVVGLSVLGAWFFEVSMRWLLGRYWPSARARVRAALNTSPGPAEAARTAGVMGATVVVVGAGVAAVAANLSLHDRFATPLFVAIFQVAAGAALVGIGAVLARAVMDFFARHSENAVVARLPLSRRRVLGLGLFLAATAYALLWLKRELLFREIDPLVVLGLIGLTLGPLGLVLSARPLPRRIARAVDVIGVVFLAALVLSNTSPKMGAQLSVRAPIASQLARALLPLSDFDRDGVPSLFGGGDCAPFDATAYPGAMEILDDGIDQDCDGTDLSVRALNVHKHPAPAPRAPDDQAELVVIITIDTLRRDELGVYGYTRHPTTPNIDRFASRAVVFDSAYSTGTVTLAGVPGLLTGRWYSYIPNFALPGGTRALDRDVLVMPEFFRRRGFQTAVVESGLLLKKHGWDRGFDHIEELSTKKVDNADEVAEAAFAWLKNHPRGKRLLWIHFMDLHHPYRDLAGFDFGRGPRDRYDESLAFVDQQLGPLLDALVDRPRTAILLLSDHGEAFGEHGAHEHGSDAYAVQVRIPMLLFAPGLKPSRVKTAVSLVDVFPTAAHLAGLDDPEVFGRSLLEIAEQAPHDTERVVFTESYWGKAYHAANTARYRLIHAVHANSWELFDIVRDPAETRNLYRPGTAPTDDLVSALSAYVARGPKLRQLRKLQQVIVDEVPPSAALDVPLTVIPALSIVGVGARRVGLDRWVFRTYFHVHRKLTETFDIVCTFTPKAGGKTKRVKVVTGNGLLPTQEWPRGKIIAHQVQVSLRGVRSLDDVAFGVELRRNGSKGAPEKPLVFGPIDVGELRR